MSGWHRLWISARSCNDKMSQQIDYVIVGKIIIDRIRLADGSYVDDLLGGGGPQTAFAARLWSESVGFMAATGTDFSPRHLGQLNEMGFDTTGLIQYEGIPTPHTIMQYDKNEMTQGGGIQTSRTDWQRLFAAPIPLPPTYEAARIVHWQSGLIDDEAMLETLLMMRANGVLFSIEPVIQFEGWWLNQEVFLELFKQVDIVTPDFPSASRIAGSDNPLEVARFWSGLGPSVIAIRDGARGSYVWEREHDRIWHIPVVNVTVVDPTGGGNAYAGGLVAGYGETGDVIRAGCYGTISAAFFVRTLGMPEMSESLIEEAHSLVDELMDRVTEL